MKGRKADQIVNHNPGNKTQGNLDVSIVQVFMKS